MPAIDHIPRRNVIDPAQAPLGIAIRLHAPCRFSEQCTGQEGGHVIQSRRRRLVKHGGMETAMNENPLSKCQPRRRMSYGFECPFPQSRLYRAGKLTKRFLQGRVTTKSTALKGTPEFTVMVSQNEDAVPVIHKIEHEAECSGTVRAMIDQITELNDETVRCDRMLKGLQIAMDVTDHTNTTALNALGKFRGRGRRKRNGNDLSSIWTTAYRIMSLLRRKTQ